MKNTEYDDIMRNEIKMRLESDAWNYRIASGVLERKKRSRKLIILSSSVSSLAVAALVLFVVLFGINKPSGLQYERFLAEQIEGTYNDVFNRKNRQYDATHRKERPISAQITGTYNEVFKESVQLTKNETINIEMLMASDVDSVIDEALTMR